MPFYHGRVGVNNSSSFKGVSVEGGLLEVILATETNRSQNS